MTVKRKLLWILIIAMFAFIWIHSMMPPDVSSDESGAALDFLKPFLEIFVGKGNVTEHLVRKLGHFSEYFALGTLLTIALRDYPVTFLRIVGIALLTSFIDETIQIFSGRGPAIVDMWIDIAGASLGCIIVLIIHKLIVLGTVVK